MNSRAHHQSGLLADYLTHLDLTTGEVFRLWAIALTPLEYKTYLPLPRHSRKTDI